MADSLKLTVLGMKCGGCENTLKTKLTALDGVSSVLVSHVEKTVSLAFEAEKISEDDILEAIEDAGFQIE